MWLPSVITSTPAANSASAIFGVIPSPPATFSPLTTTNVGLVALAQDRQAVEQRAPADAADEVADKQDARARPAASAAASASAILCRWWEAGERRLRGQRPQRLRPASRSGADGLERRAAADRSRRASWSRAGCSSCCCRSRLLLLWALAKAAGKVVLDLHRRGCHRADPQPGRGASCSARGFRAAWRCWWCISHSSWPWLGSACCSPTLSPIRCDRSRTTCRISSTKPTHARQLAERTSPNRASTCSSSSRARPRCRRSRTRSPRACGKIVSFSGGLLTEARQRRLRPGARVRAVGLHARLRRAHRRARAPADANGDGTRGRRLSDARPARGLALRRRAAAVQRHHGNDGRRGAVPVRRARHLPRRRRRTRSRSAPSSA